VPVAETSELESTRAARAAYEQGKAGQRSYLRPPVSPASDPNDEKRDER
jgi:3D-(3,5/4)-trihydroxycyclohexane-1,2-dione acylhydrolase (decyclizing)